MPGQAGNQMLLKVDATSNGTFVTVAGIRSRNITLNSTAVDITSSDSTGRWRELLSGAGARRASISGSGVFVDEASDVSVRSIFMNGTIVPWQIVVPNFGSFSGLFQITTLTYSGALNSEVTFNISLESAGAITFAATP